MSIAHTNLAEQLQALRDAFRGSLPGRLAAIGQALDVLADHPDQPALIALRADVHRLAGAAGTFGMPDLGARAQALEFSVQALLAAPADGTVAAAVPQLRALYTAMTDEFPGPVPPARSEDAPSSQSR